MLEELMGSRLRARLLGWLMPHPDEWYFVRQLTGILKEDSTNLSRELARLSRLGILLCRSEGKQKYYQVNRKCPVYPELRGLVIKTVGVGDSVRKALAPLANRIRVAFIYGSFARGEETPDSDIDLLVVGDLALKPIASHLGPVARELGREMNPSVYPPSEFRRKARDGHRFLRDVMAGEKIFLIGDEDDLKELAG